MNFTIRGKPLQNENMPFGQWGCRVAGLSQSPGLVLSQLAWTLSWMELLLQKLILSFELKDMQYNIRTVSSTKIEIIFNGQIYVFYNMIDTSHFPKDFYSK